MATTTITGDLKDWCLVNGGCTPTTRCLLCSAIDEINSLTALANTLGSALTELHESTTFVDLAPIKAAIREWKTRMPGTAITGQTDSPDADTDAANTYLAIGSSLYRGTGYDRGSEHNR